VNHRSSQAALIRRLWRATFQPRVSALFVRLQVQVPLAAVCRTARAHAGKPSSRLLDELLDERLAQAAVHGSG